MSQGFIDNYGFATVPDVQANAYNSAADTGVADAHVVALVPAVTSYVANMPFFFTPSANNATTTPTFNGGAGARVVVKAGGALAANDLVAGTPAELLYSAVNNNFVLINPQTIPASGITPLQIQDRTFLSAADSGAINNYVGAFAPVIGALVDGMILTVTNLSATNTTAAHFNAGTGSFPILTPGFNALVGGEMVLANDYNLQWSATHTSWILQNSSLVVASVTAAQVQASSFNTATDTGGGINVYVVNVSPTPGALTNGMRITFTAAHNCTGNSTLNIGTGVNPIRKVGWKPTNGFTNLDDQDIKAGCLVVVEWSVTNTAWILLNPHNSNISIPNLQQSAFTTLVDVAPNGTAYTCFPDPSLSNVQIAFTDSQIFNFTPANTNTITNPTLDISGVGPVTIVRENNAALQIGDIVAGQNAQVVYQLSSNLWRLMNPQKLSALAVTPAQVQNTTFNYGQDTGTANARAIALSPAPTSYAGGLFILMETAVAANTGATTINVNGLGAIPLIDNSTQAALVGGEIPPGGVCAIVVRASGTQAVLIDPIQVRSVSMAVLFGSPVALTSSVTANVTSILLPPGTWVANGNVGFIGAAGTTVASTETAISDTSATMSNTAFVAKNIYPGSLTLGADTLGNAVSGYGMINSTGSTTIYLVARASFAVSSLSACGIISAVRG